MKAERTRKWRETMPKPKKDSHPFSIRMEQETYERLEEYCDKSGQSKTVAIERAVNFFIDDYDEKMKIIEKVSGEL